MPFYWCVYFLFYWSNRTLPKWCGCIPSASYVQHSTVAAEHSQNIRRMSLCHVPYPTLVISSWGSMFKINVYTYIYKTTRTVIKMYFGSRKHLAQVPHPSTIDNPWVPLPRATAISKPRRCHPLSSGDADAKGAEMHDVSMKEWRSGCDNDVVS